MLLPRKTKLALATAALALLVAVAVISAPAVLRQLNPAGRLVGTWTLSDEPKTKYTFKESGVMMDESDGRTTGIAYRLRDGLIEFCLDNGTPFQRYRFEFLGPDTVKVETEQGL